MRLKTMCRSSQNAAKRLEQLANERRQVLQGVVTAIWQLHTDSEDAFAEGPMLLKTLGGMLLSSFVDHCLSPVVTVCPLLRGQMCLTGHVTVSVWMIGCGCGDRYTMLELLRLASTKRTHSHSCTAKQSCAMLPAHRG